VRPPVVVRSFRPTTVRALATRFGPLPVTVVGAVVVGAVGDIGVVGDIGAVDALAVEKVWSTVIPIPSTELSETSRQW
jgi:hypothetical protein